MSKDFLPGYDKFLNPVLYALRMLGGSGTVEEINAKVIEIAGLATEQLEIPHNPEKGGISEVEYRLAWTRTYLKKAGLLENSARKVWSLTPDGSRTESVNERQLVKTVREQARSAQKFPSEEEVVDVDAPIAKSWRDHLIDILLNINPDAFERLVQRILRESGFIQVEVTGQSGDGGIDGHGIVRIGGLISFRVIFQCKRWQGPVRANQIRDFRGSMVGRADKGLFVTTSTFTPDAVKEATRDGAPTIDLIDGEQLLDKLKELSLGVKSEQVIVEQITVLEDWFNNL
jgi:restriction system protein